MSPSILPPFDFCGLAALVHFRAPLKSSLLLLFFRLSFCCSALYLPRA